MLEWRDDDEISLNEDGWRSLGTRVFEAVVTPCLKRRKGG
jgi:hypothetical protein